MSQAEPPLSYPPLARRAFGGDEEVRRLAKVARWTSGARVLHFRSGSGTAGLFLARDVGCVVTALDRNEKAIGDLRDRVKSLALEGQLSVRLADLRKPGLPEADFDGIVADGGLPWDLSGSLAALRPYLAPKGRLCLVWPVKVGRQPMPQAVAFWEKKLGEPLLLPRGALMAFEKAGYEPLTVECLPDADLESFYSGIEAQVGQLDPEPAQALRDEMALHRSQAGRASVTFALLLGRRKEPGEKPPPSRSDG